MIDQLYIDFTTQLLPKIQEGLVITKEYFIDLFGRYVKYLIITDSLMLGLSLMFFIASIVFAVWAVKRILKEIKKDDDATILFPLLFLVMIIPFTVSILLIIVSTDDLIKDIYIPEVRVYEELSSNLTK